VATQPHLDSAPRSPQNPLRRPIPRLTINQVAPASHTEDRTVSSDAAAVLDRARTETERDELRDGHHPMLPSRQLGQRNVGCGDLGLTMRLN
jgi:hypothetical protein